MFASGLYLGFFLAQGVLAVFLQQVTCQPREPRSNVHRDLKAELRVRMRDEIM